MDFLLIITFIGLTECAMEPFVVQGKNASVKSFPHSVFINVLCETKDKNDTKLEPWVCGASIVNERIIMTAAHCITGCGFGSKISVYAGKKRKNRGFMSSVLSHLVHGHYDVAPPGGDLALMRLKTQLKYSDVVKRVALMKNPPYFEKARVAGWGFINEEKLEKAKYLQYTTQYVWKHEDCVKKLKSIPAGTICASSKNFKSYASRGDSGSALVVRGYIQIGLVSHKLPRVSRNIVVYTDIGYYFDWIKKNSRKLYCS